ncbi:hypothetical protein Tco_1121144 [Tanacetum coccineum]|uniref:Uncharacterized protein n=1 Tax=Tanacetum coccineum TaxID=301880 RepID=A0ABQ5IX18_9ASTR
MGDENHIRTLRDYSKPSHEGYMNTIQLLVGNNMVPLRSDTIRLVQNGCSFHGLRSEDPNQQLKDFLKLVDSLDLDGENRERMCLQERVGQLEDYMRAIAKEFMEFSSEVVRRLKERIKENENKPRKIEKITKYPDTKVLENSVKRDLLENLEMETFPTSTNLLCIRHAMSKRARSTRGQASLSREETMEEKVRKFGWFDNGNHQMNYNNLVGRSIHSEDVVDSEFLSNKGLAQPFFNFINTDTFSRPQWVNLFQINKPIFRKLVRELFASFELTPPLVVGLYSERESQNAVKLSRLRGAEMVNSTHLTHMFWPIIGDGGYNVGNPKAKSIRNQRIKGMGYLQHPLLACQLPKECKGYECDFWGDVCNKDSSVLCLLTNKMVSMLNREPPPYVHRKTSLVKMGVIMELYEGECCWSATREVVEDGEGDDEEGDGEGGNKGIGGSTDIYRNMSQGDWQVRQERWMDQQDEH